MLANDTIERGNNSYLLTKVTFVLTDDKASYEEEDEEVTYVALMHKIHCLKLWPRHDVLIAILKLFVRQC